MELMERRRILLNTPHINIVTGLQFVTDMVAPIESLVINFSPIQDLHGYDSPWPAGGGKNLLNASADTGSLNGVNYTKNGDGTYTVNGTANGTSSFVVGSIELTANTQYVVSGCPSGGSGSSYNVRIRDANYTALGFDVGNGATITPTETKTYYYQITVVSGYSVSNLVFKPMICLSTAPDPDYAHFAPYSNICPISGRTGLDVTITGKNLFGYDESKVLVGETSTGTIRSYYPTGITNSTITFSAHLIDSSNVTSAFINIGKLVNGKLNIVGTFLSTTGDITNKTVTFAEGEEAILISAVAEMSGIKSNLPKYNIQLELGSTATAYEPYHSTTHSISWQTEAGTVYGGNLDVTTGLLTVTMVSVDLSQLSSTYQTYGKRYRFYPSGMKSYSSRSIDFFISNYTPSLAAATGDNGTAFIYLTSLYIYSEDAENAPVGQFVYTLATPISYQLTPEQVLAFKGTNNLSMPGRVKFWTHRD